jgi:phospholipid-binding lipoprotein MlaA
MSMTRKILPVILLCIAPLALAAPPESRRDFIENIGDAPEEQQKAAPEELETAPPVLEDMETQGTDEQAEPWMEDDDLSFLDDDEEILEVYDPWETFNRGMFLFNDKAYFWVMKPVARGWRWLAPEPLRLGIRNFFSNLRAPIRFINAALQGKFRVAGDEITRFAVNSTLGIGGLYDPAKAHWDIEMQIEDTGQTLAHYGVGPGPYLVLPFLGPSNVRDGIGLFPDIYYSLVPQVFENRYYWIAISADIINFLSIDKDTYEGIKRDALDPYLFLRDAYSQYRLNLILH